MTRGTCKGYKDLMEWFGIRTTLREWEEIKLSKYIFIALQRGELFASFISSWQSGAS